MTSQLSEVAKDRLEEVKSIPLEEAAYSCLQKKLRENIGGKITPRNTVRAISKSMKKAKISNYLFADSTGIRDQGKIIERSNNWLSSGFVINGHTHQLETPFNWTPQTEFSRNHRFKIQAWIMIDELLRASEIEPKGEYFVRSRNIAVDWINQHIFSEREDPFKWYDMGTGQRGALLAYILHKSLLNHDSKWILASKSEKSDECLSIIKMVIAAEIHIRELMCEERLASHSNHGLFQMAGLLALTSSLPFLSISELGREFAVKKIESMLAGHFFENGFHKEHSPTYHVLICNYLHRLSVAGWLKDSPKLESLLEHSKQVAQFYIMPNGYFSPIGDTYMRAKSDELCIFDVNEDTNGMPSSPAGLHIFRKGGIAISASNDGNGCADEHLVLIAQFHSRQHKHADDLGINYCVKGQPFLVDSGTYRYQYDLEERMFVESSRAHNTIEIDGLNFSRFRLDKYGSALKNAYQVGECSFIEAEVTHQHLTSPTIPNNQITTDQCTTVDVEHRRMLIHKARCFLLVIDQLKSEDNHEYVQWFHLADHLQLNITAEDTIEVLKPDSSIHSTIHLINQDIISSKIISVKGQTEPELQGWHSKDGMELKPNHSLGRKVNAKSIAIATMFDLQNGPKKPFLNIGSDGKYIRFAIDQPTGTSDITIRYHGDGTASVNCIDNDEEYTVEVERW